MARNAYRILLQGAVQGQGIRPTIARLAEEQGWSGTVRNTAAGVELTVTTASQTQDDIERLLRDVLPALQALQCEEGSDEGWADFVIAPSAADASLATPVPRDAAVCPTCLAETQTPGDRRFRYGLTSCATCGPRYSLLHAMPFDRARTALQSFPLCPACQSEYESPANRRRHAQTIACPDCGPQVWTSDRDGRRLAHGDEALLIAAEALQNDGVVALRGVGGYQLLVDATSSCAVAELRRRKERPTKPLAVLCGSIAVARQLGILDAISERELLSPANPIVLVPLQNRSAVVPEVHPHLTDIGLLLPTTALHARLVELVDRPLVCTSGNRDGEPLVFAVDDAQRALSGIADRFVHHNREILQPIDDSVVRPMAGTVVTLRCARGLAPLPLPMSGPPVLALGAQLKSACAWSNGRQAALGPHVGDLQDLATRERWIDHIAAMTGLYRLDHAMLAVDAHPDGFPRIWSESTGRETLHVWHHHAHVVSGMVEHGWCDRTVLGIAADGTGWGPDGTLWGGEVLISTLTEFRRVAHVRPMSLSGGEAAIQEIWRTSAAALGQLHDLSIPAIAACVDRDVLDVRQIIDVCRSGKAPQTTSLGRLFDVAACLTLGMAEVRFEGEAAMRLEAACDPAASGEYLWRFESGDPLLLDWRPVLKCLTADRARGVAAAVMAERFHRGVASWMVEVVRAIPRSHGLSPGVPVVFSGGVFQNRRLVELLVERWPAECGPLGLPGRIPPNDGGLAAGQLAIALARDPRGTARFWKEW